MKNLPRKTWHLFLLLLLVCVGFSPASIAHTAEVKISPDVPLRLIWLDPQVRKRYVPPPVQLLTNANMSAGANIVVNYNGSGWTTQAVEAFEFAVTIWESLITSPVNIVVEASFEPLGTNILGGAGPVTMVSGFPNAPLGNTWYPVAIANKLAGSDLDKSSADIVAEFSSNFLGWHFGTGSSTPGDRISFVSVVLHELGHGLGFLGSMEAGSLCGNPNWGCYGIGGDPFIYDRFVENGSGLALLSFNNNSTQLAEQLTSGDLYFDSPGGNFANGNSRVPIYAPSTWSDGSSYSHLAESFNSTNHSLMTYSISYGETIHHPGAVTLCMFAEMGWTVSETCSSGPDTPISGLSADNDGPTVFGTATQLSADITDGSNVSYEWNFGDGTNGSGKTVSHQYAAPGNYTAEVTAANSTSTANTTTSVVVEVPISGLMLAHDGPTLLGNSTNFSASIASGSNVTFEWDFGDGNFGSGTPASHLYENTGVYIVELTGSNQVSVERVTNEVHVVEQLERIYLPILVRESLE